MRRELITWNLLIEHSEKWVEDRVYIHFCPKFRSTGNMFLKIKEYLLICKNNDLTIICDKTSDDVLTACNYAEENIPQEIMSILNTLIKSVNV